MKHGFKHIGENVRKARLNKGLTLEQLAELVGVSGSYLGVAERGRTGFSIETIVSIANVLGVTTDSLLLENYQGKQQMSTRLDTLVTMLQNDSDFEIDYLIECIKLCKSRVILKPKNQDND